VTLTPKPNGYEIRLRYGHQQRDRFLLRCDEATAADREPRMEAMAHKLSKLVDDSERAKGLLQEAGAAAGDAKKFSAVERVVDKICAEAAGSTPRSAASGTLSTFRDVAEAWTSGKLTELYPGHKLLPKKLSRKADTVKVSVFLPLLGAKLVRDITKAHTDEARRLIPSGVEDSTRLAYLKTLRLVLKIAHDPLDLIDTIPMRSLPKGDDGRQFWFLFPQEEARLLGEEDKVPLLYRVLYGFLSRNGTRISETLRLTYGHVDFTSGRIRIEAAWTKTQRPRFWKLDKDVLRALKRWRAAQGNPPDEARIFGGRTGKLTSHTIRKRFREDLLAAGIDRAELHQRTLKEGSLRVHDLRASFITLALRAGWPLKTIMARSGHESVTVLQKYDRLVQDANELDLPPWFAEMDQAIPEFRRAARVEAERLPVPELPAGVGQAWARTQNLPVEMGSHTSSRWTREPGSSDPNPAEKPPSVTPETSLHPTSGPASFQGVGQTGPGEGGPGPLVGTAEIPSTDPVEKALSYALEQATQDRRYDVVLAVTRELEQRRLARAASNVTSLDSRRKPKGEGK